MEHRGFQTSVRRGSRVFHYLPLKSTNFKIKINKQKKILYRVKKKRSEDKDDGGQTRWEIADIIGRNESEKGEEVEKKKWRDRVIWDTMNNYLTMFSSGIRIIVIIIIIMIVIIVIITIHYYYY